MHADIQGALAQIDKSWKAFTHEGKPMTKVQVKAALEYDVKMGYKTTKELVVDPELDKIIKNAR